MVSACPCRAPIVNTLTFVLSACAVAGIGSFGSRRPASTQQIPIAKRLTRGFGLVTENSEVRLLLVANTAVLAAWTVGVSLGLPFLVAEIGLSGFGLTGLGAVAALVAAYGAGDFLSNFWVAAHRPRRLGRFMFNGYALLASHLLWCPFRFGFYRRQVGCLQ